MKWHLKSHQFHPSPSDWITNIRGDKRSNFLCLSFVNIIISHLCQRDRRPDRSGSSPSCLWVRYTLHRNSEIMYCSNKYDNGKQVGETYTSCRGDGESIGCWRCLCRALLYEPNPFDRIMGSTWFGIQIRFPLLMVNKLRNIRWKWVVLRCLWSIEGSVRIRTNPRTTKYFFTAAAIRREKSFPFTSATRFLLSIRTGAIGS